LLGKAGQFRSPGGSSDDFPMTTGLAPRPIEVSVERGRAELAWRGPSG
jgi:hypothetical protein